MPAQPSSAKTALLTVGSTQFDDLVKAALEPASLQALRNHGITRFIVQYGEGNIRQILRYVALDPEGGFPTVSGGVSCTINTGEDVHVEMYPFLDDIDQRMSSADIVISHAGAGSVLAALRGPALSPAKKHSTQLVIVPNDSLMDSHQSELAVEMAKHGWAAVASPRTLAETIQELSSTTSLKGSTKTAFPLYEPIKIQSILDEQMGWS